MRSNLHPFLLRSLLGPGCQLGILIALATALPAAQPAKLYHGAAYYPELWPETDIDRDIAEMKKLGINVVRIGEFAWARMEPNEGDVSLAFFQRVLDRLHEAQIDVVLCTPTATPPVWLSYGHPERSFVDSEGRVMIHGARQHMSYENEAVRSACWRIVEAEARALGRHPAVVAWQIDNELKCHVGEDYSASAVDDWHKWLAQRYGTIDRLNSAWGTQIWSQHYQRFEQVPAPLRTPFLHNASLSTAYRVFNRERIAEFLDEQCSIIRRYSAAPITTNMNRWFSISVERMSQNLDFVAFDDYPSSDEWRTLMLDVDLFRPAKPGRAFWMLETSSAHNGSIRNYEPVHPPGFLVAEAVSVYASGSQSFCYWLWRQQRTGCELPHSAIESAWYEPGIGYPQVVKVEAARRQLEPLLASTRPAAAQVAVTWSDLGRAMMQTEPIGSREGSEVSYDQALPAWEALLLDMGVHRELRFEGAPLGGLKLLVTPLMPYASPEFLSRVEAFARDGGVWISGPATGMRTGEHTVPTDAGLGAVEKLAGVRTVYSFPVTGSGARGEAFGASAALGGWCSALKAVSPDATAVGQLDSELTPGLAFLTERQLGRGRIVVMAAQPEGPEGRVLLEKIIAHYEDAAGVTERYSVSVGTVVWPRVTEKGDKLWIVVNMDGRGGEVQLPRAAADAISGERIPGDALKLGRYEWRAVRF
ncbi:MAG TPA: beta-galactosidase [Opitutaceae bacterium]|nr:beta-galactosidase [Opitutaceae bacterium]